jgi:MoxR-like ATPase
LPEAQLDRFMFYVNVSYPSAREEVEIVRSTTVSRRPPLHRVLSPHKIRDLQDLVLRVPAADHVIQYAVELVRRTRPGEPGAPDFVKEHVSWGAGPRASQYLVLGAKSRAILDGRMAASVEDVKALARNVLVHRVITNFRAESEGVTSAQLVDRLLEKVKA